MFQEPSALDKHFFKDFWIHSGSCFIKTKQDTLNINIFIQYELFKTSSPFVRRVIKKYPKRDIIKSFFSNSRSQKHSMAEAGSFGSHLVQCSAQVGPPRAGFPRLHSDSFLVSSPQSEIPQCLWATCLVALKSKKMFPDAQRELLCFCVGLLPLVLSMCSTEKSYM